MVSKDDISVDPTKVELKLFSNKRDRVMCLRFFIENFSRIVHSITKLTRKGVKFEWDQKCPETFQEFKRRLTTTPVLFTLMSVGRNTWCIVMHQRTTWDVS